MSKDLVTKENQLPSSDLGLGFEDMQGQDFSAPFLVICQANSPYCNPQHTLYIPEAKQSNIINTQNGNVYEEVNIIPCKYAFRNVEWRPRGSGGGFISSFTRETTPNDLVSDPLSGKVKRSNGNEIMPTAYYLCLLMEENFDRVIIPMYSTQLKKSRKWNSLMESQKQNGQSLPIFSRIYRLSVVAESNQKGTWYGWKIDINGGTIVDLGEDIYNLSKETHNITNFLPEKLLESVAQSMKTEDEVPF